MSTIRIYRQNPDTYEREPLGTISESQLGFLIDNLEEELEEDEDYWMNQATIEYLRDLGADEILLRLLEKAIAGSSEGVDISYQIE
ncbi:MAG TPA: galactosyldiacylglycerol synthase [Acidobacteriota bacterium]|nr:galactosyldiacylglycerol synthase [Acidobacteriota bacterium]